MMKVMLAVLMLALAGEADAKDLGDWKQLHSVSGKPVYLAVSPAKWVNKETGKPVGPAEPTWFEGEVAEIFESSAVVKIYGFPGASFKEYPYSVLAMTFLFGGSLNILSDKETGDILCAVVLLDHSNLAAVMRRNGLMKRILTLGIAPSLKYVYKDPDARWEKENGKWIFLR